MIVVVSVMRALVFVAIVQVNVRATGMLKAFQNRLAFVRMSSAETLAGQHERNQKCGDDSLHLVRNLFGFDSWRFRIRLPRIGRIGGRVKLRESIARPLSG